MTKILFILLIKIQKQLYLLKILIELLIEYKVEFINFIINFIYGKKNHYFTLYVKLVLTVR